MDPTSRPLIVSRQSQPGMAGSDRCRPVRVGDIEFGGQRPLIIAGPCAVESREQTLTIARQVREAGADMLRGGAYKPRKSPYSFQGLGEEGLKILAEAREATGLPFVTEVMDPRLVELIASYADVLQIGSRSMHSTPILIEVGKSGKPVLLKRGWCATLDEWLNAAEYIACQGNLDIIMCERGIRTFSRDEYNRNTLDLNVVPAMQKETFLPLIVDPSHSTGRADLAVPVAKAALAAGAHGLIIEVIAAEKDRPQILCDARQGILPSELQEIVAEARRRADGGA
jgi:3-deoxy-7-phosphoheptulonate synthase